MIDQVEAIQTEQAQAWLAAYDNNWAKAKIPASINGEEVTATEVIILNPSNRDLVCILKVPGKGAFFYEATACTLTQEQARALGYLVTLETYYMPIELLFNSQYSNILQDSSTAGMN